MNQKLLGVAGILVILGIAFALSTNRKAIRIRIRFTPVSRPLFPGYPLSEQAWSEIRYTAYCYVYPGVKK